MRAAVQALRKQGPARIIVAVPVASADTCADFKQIADENPALFTAVNSDTCEILHLLVPYDPEAAQSWSDRAVTVIRATQAGELLPRITDKPDDWRCRMCPHSDRCWKD